MAEFVKKTALGYKRVSDDAWTPSVTHVIETWEEYFERQRYIQSLISDKESTLSKTGEKHRDEIAKIKKDLEKKQCEDKRKILREHDAELTKKEKVINEQNRIIAELQNCVQKKDEDVETWKSQNTNLIRIARERGNQSRGITPKKLHHGYLTISSGQTFDRVQIKDPSWERDTITISKLVWKTVIQSPYSVLMPIDTISKTILGELAESVFTEMGIETSIVAENGEYPKYPDDERECIVYKWLFRTSRSGYWEIEIWTTGAVIILERNLPPHQTSSKHLSNRAKQAGRSSESTSHKKQSRIKTDRLMNDGDHEDTVSAADEDADADWDYDPIGS